MQRSARPREPSLSYHRCSHLQPTTLAARSHLRCLAANTRPLRALGPRRQAFPLGPSTGALLCFVTLQNDSTALGTRVQLLVQLLIQRLALEYSQLLMYAAETLRRARRAACNTAMQIDARWLHCWIAALFAAVHRCTSCAVCYMLHLVRCL